MKTSSKRFRLVRFAFETDAGGIVYRHFITDRFLPAHVLNEWLETNYMRSAQTGKEYGKKLITFLNYLDDNEIEYNAATNRDVKAFFHRMIYGDLADLKLHSLQRPVSYSTLSKYLTVITALYRWLDDNYETGMRFRTDSKKMRASKSFLYGQIYSYDYKHLIGINLPRLGGRREYIKWYADSEIKVLSENFLTLRDAVVFKITLEGFRIDEALSMRLVDYDPAERCIRPSRSKGREDAIYGMENPHRIIALPIATCALLDRYLQTERMLAENQSGRISEYIFINLNRGSVQGEPLRYLNYYKIFKACALRAGLDPVKVRTHSGRSTKVMRMLECGSSDTDILHQTGWRRIDSITSYRDENNPIVARRILRKLHPEEGFSDD
jgi:integrase/recombinase XerD